MIEVKALSKVFEGKTAVDEISFQIPEGETMVLLGTSGCGKTTTLKMINRLIEPSSGSVYVGGKDVKLQTPEELRRNIGYVIQSVGLFPHYTVEQNIGLVPSLLEWSKKRTKERCTELMHLMGLPETMLTRFPHELSGGQQQRVGLARALAADPELVLLDEPFGALDPITKQQIQKEFLRLDTIKNKTMLMVSHDVFEAITLGDKICLMDKGKIQQQGSAQELIFRPKNSFVKSFFNTQRFRLELQVVNLKDIVPLITNETEQVHSMCIDLQDNISLLDALETLEREDASYVNILQTAHKKRPSLMLSREKLIQYFYQLKKQWSEA